MQTHWKKYVLKTVEKKDLHEVKTNLRQGGRSWQPFGEGKIGHTTLSQAHI